MVKILTSPVQGDVPFGGHKATGLADPTSAQDASTKAYVDAVAQGLSVKASVRAASTANIASQSGLLTVDGVTLVDGDRVLAKDQTTGSTNGIWVAHSGAWTRAADADAAGELVGAFVFVEEGATNAGSGWVQTAAAPITVGTTSLTWTQFSGAGQIVAGAGLAKAGNTLRRAASATGYANLAALPSAAANNGLLERTADGGIYESDGSAWQPVRDPSGTYAPANVALANYSLPHAFGLSPVQTGTGIVFEPFVGTRQWMDSLNSLNAVASTDFSLWVDSNPTGTETLFDAITYPTVEPFAAGWKASTVLVDSTGTVTIAVDVFVERLTRSVTRKRIVLTPSAATTVRLRQAHCDHWIANSPGGASSKYGSVQLYPPSGVNHGQLANAATATFNRGSGGGFSGQSPGYTSALTSTVVGLIQPDAWLSGLGTLAQTNILESGQIASPTFQFWFAVNAGIGSGGGKMLALAANTPTEVEFVYYASRSDQHVASIARAVGEAHRWPRDLFKRAMFTGARSLYSITGDADTSIWQVAGPAYNTTCHIRDSFWTSMGFDDAQRAQLLLKKFGASTTAGGIPPTNFVLGGSPNYGNDESAALLLMWMAWLSSHAGIHDPGSTSSDTTGLPDSTPRLRAITHLLSVVNESGYGTFSSWLDAFAPTASESLAYSTGIAWCGLKAGQRFAGTTSVPQATLDLIKTAYQSYWNGQYMDYSRSTAGVRTASSPLLSPSPLAGEFFAQILFGTSLLTDAMVSGHLDTLFANSQVTLPGGPCFKVLCNADGSYLPPASFTGSRPQGNYQNGGSWLLWDFVACAVGKMHGYTNHDLDAWWSQRRATELAVEATSHEYLNTQSGTGYGSLGSNTSWSYGWNTLCAFFEDALGFKYARIPVD